MRYEVTVGERTVHVEIAPDGGLLVDDRAVALDAAPAGVGAWTMRLDGACHEVHALSRDPMRLWVDGREVRATVMDERALAARRVGGRAPSGRHELRSPMPGLIKAVHVSEGDAVERGGPLVTLEAMKMENELRAPEAGRVTRVVASPGTKVEAGALLVVLAPE
ncbi:MAG: biotin/lipoyl-binding protein [Chloroflexi bacterium]|nr:biotin/lipoyl-binding protein [Chloroflexota bacterium]